MGQSAQETGDEGEQARQGRVFRAGQRCGLKKVGSRTLWPPRPPNNWTTCSHVLSRYQGEGLHQIPRDTDKGKPCTTHFSKEGS